MRSASSVKLAQIEMTFLIPAFKVKEIVEHVATIGKIDMFKDEYALYISPINLCLEQIKPNSNHPI